MFAAKGYNYRSFSRDRLRNDVRVPVKDGEGGRD